MRPLSLSMPPLQICGVSGIVGFLKSFKLFNRFDISTCGHLSCVHIKQEPGKTHSGVKTTRDRYNYIYCTCVVASHRRLSLSGCVYSAMCAHSSVFLMLKCSVHNIISCLSRNRAGLHVLATASLRVPNVSVPHIEELINDRCA